MSKDDACCLMGMANNLIYHFKFYHRTCQAILGCVDRFVRPSTIQKMILNGLQRLLVIECQQYSLSTIQLHLFTSLVFAA